MVFEIECDYVGNFHHGVAKVKIGAKFGFINKEGKFIIEAKYNTVSDFSEGLVAGIPNTEIK